MTLAITVKFMLSFANKYDLTKRVIVISFEKKAIAGMAEAMARAGTKCKDLHYTYPLAIFVTKNKELQDHADSLHRILGYYCDFEGTPATPPPMGLVLRLGGINWKGGNGAKQFILEAETIAHERGDWHHVYFLD